MFGKLLVTQVVTCLYLENGLELRFLWISPVPAVGVWSSFDSFGALLASYRGGSTDSRHPNGFLDYRGLKWS